MGEWLKPHASKACIRGTVSGVRIPLSPPIIDLILPPLFRSALIGVRSAANKTCLCGSASLNPFNGCSESHNLVRANIINALFTIYYGRNMLQMYSKIFHLDSYCYAAMLRCRVSFLRLEV